MYYILGDYVFDLSVTFSAIFLAIPHRGRPSRVSYQQHFMNIHHLRMNIDEGRALERRFSHLHSSTSARP